MGRNKPLPLQDMVDSIVKEAEARVAGADDTVEPDVEKVASVQDDDLVDLEYAEKLAGAVAYVAECIGDETTKEAHGNPETALTQLKPRKDKQSEDFGGVKMIPDSPPMEEKGTKFKSLKSSHKGEGVKLSEADRGTLKQAILEKLGSGVDNPPNMGDGPVADPPGSFKSGDEPRKAPGGGGHQHVASNEAAINMDKGQAAKATTYPDLHKALAKHRLNRGTDPVLHNNLQNASKAGVKIAGAKQELSKIAAAGCGCDGNGTCSYCRLNVLSGGTIAVGADQPAQ
jgi:hypothetical protein